MAKNPTYTGPAPTGMSVSKPGARAFDWEITIPDMLIYKDKAIVDANKRAGIKVMKWWIVNKFQERFRGGSAIGRKLKWAARNPEYLKKRKFLAKGFKDAGDHLVRRHTLKRALPANITITAKKSTKGIDKEDRVKGGKGRFGIRVIAKLTNMGDQYVNRRRGGKIDMTDEIKRMAPDEVEAIAVGMTTEFINELTADKGAKKLNRRTVKKYLQDNPGAAGHFEF